jgi:integrase
VTLAEFAREWLAAIESTVRPATHYSYSRNVKLHLLPYLGSARLVSIDAGALNSLYARLLTDGRRNQAGGGLSPRSVRYLHTITHRMLKDAVRWSRLARNPADAADPPKAAASARSEMVTWTAAEVRAFLAGTRDDRLGPAFVMLATTGARRGEVLGLRWTDLDTCRASIRQTVITENHAVHIGEPKTAKGQRMITLAPATIAALREHRRRQAAERLLMGAGWTDHGLVFCHVDGGPLHPERFSRTFAERSRQLGLRRIRLHGLRHTWATLALADGVHPKVVQERLGHATIGITFGTYSHVTRGMHADAAALIAGRIFGTARTDG